MGTSQHTLIQVDIPGIKLNKKTDQVLRFCGSESIGGSYTYFVILATAKPLDITKQLLRQPITVTYPQLDRNQKKHDSYVHGVISRVVGGTTFATLDFTHLTPSNELQQDTLDKAQEVVKQVKKELANHYCYLLNVVSWFDFLKVNRYRKFYPDARLSNILDDKFASINFSGFGSYKAKHEFSAGNVEKVLLALQTLKKIKSMGKPKKAEIYTAAQWDESDYDFITRLLANSGLIWYFKHEKKQLTLVICSPDDFIEQQSHAAQPVPLAYDEVSMTHSTTSDVFHHAPPYSLANITQPDAEVPATLSLDLSADLLAVDNVPDVIKNEHAYLLVSETHGVRVGEFYHPDLGEDNQDKQLERSGDSRYVVKTNIDIMNCPNSQRARYEAYVMLAPTLLASYPGVMVPTHRTQPLIGRVGIPKGAKASWGQRYVDEWYRVWVDLWPGCARWVSLASGGRTLDVPPIGTDVLISFDHGDPNQPMVIGVLPASEVVEKPEETVLQAKTPAKTQVDVSGALAAGAGIGAAAYAMKDMTMPEAPDLSGFANAVDDQLSAMKDMPSALLNKAKNMPNPAAYLKERGEKIKNRVSAGIDKRFERLKSAKDNLPTPELPDFKEQAALLDSMKDALNKDKMLGQIGDMANSMQNALTESSLKHMNNLKSAYAGMGGKFAALGEALNPAKALANMNKMGGNIRGGLLDSAGKKIDAINKAISDGINLGDLKFRKPDILGKIGNIVDPKQLLDKMNKARDAVNRDMVRDAMISCGFMAAGAGLAKLSSGEALTVAKKTKAKDSNTIQLDNKKQAITIHAASSYIEKLDGSITQEVGDYKVEANELLAFQVGTYDADMEKSNMAYKEMAMAAMAAGGATFALQTLKNAEKEQQIKRQALKANMKMPKVNTSQLKPSTPGEVAKLQRLQGQMSSNDFSKLSQQSLDKQGVQDAVMKRAMRMNSSLQSQANGQLNQLTNMMDVNKLKNPIDSKSYLNKLKGMRSSLLKQAKPNTKDILNIQKSLDGQKSLLKSVFAAPKIDTKIALFSAAALLAKLPKNPFKKKSTSNASNIVDTTSGGDATFTFKAENGKVKLGVSGMEISPKGIELAGELQIGDVKVVKK